MQLIGQLLFQIKREERGEEGHHLQSIVGLLGHKKEKGTEKGGQDAVNQLTALPNKKGEERKGRLLLVIMGSIGCKKGKGTGKEGQDVVNQPTALPNKKGEERRGDMR